jgi:hypothetical protein
VAVGLQSVLRCLSHLIDQWKDQSATTYTASRTVTAGNHELKVEYYENAGDAVAKMAIAP